MEDGPRVNCGLHMRRALPAEDTRKACGRPREAVSAETQKKLSDPERPGHDEAKNKTFLFCLRGGLCSFFQGLQAQDETLIFPCRYLVFPESVRVLHALLRGTPMAQPPRGSTAKEARGSAHLGN